MPCVTTCLSVDWDMMVYCGEKGGSLPGGAGAFRKTMVVVSRLDIPLDSQSLPVCQGENSRHPGVAAACKRCASSVLSPHPYASAHPLPSLSMRVPMRLPLRALTMLPVSPTLKTTTGMQFSWHSVIAVMSITDKFFSATSR